MSDRSNKKVKTRPADHQEPAAPAREVFFHPSINTSNGAVPGLTVRTNSSPLTPNSTMRHYSEASDSANSTPRSSRTNNGSRMTEIVSPLRSAPATGQQERHTSLRGGDHSRLNPEAVHRHRSLVRPERSRSRLRGHSEFRSSRRWASGVPGAADDEDDGSLGGGPGSGRRCQWWTAISRCLTCFASPCCLQKCGKSDPLMQQAWREKTALCLIIALSCIALGFITFGMTTVVCRPDSFVYKHSKVKGMNSTSERWYIIHGYIYNIPEKYSPYPHPESPYNPLPSFAGKDITVFFPYAPSCASIGLTYTFKCKSPKLPFEFCHDTELMAKLDKVGQVNWDWDEVEPSPNLLAYNGYVLDIGYYLEQISPNMVNKPFGNDIDAIFRASVGGDATRALSKYPKQVIRCLLENFGAGTLDVKSVGCIFTDIVLYVSLVVILAVVLIKFILAVIFTVFFSRKLGNFEAEKRARRRSRQNDASSLADHRAHSTGSRSSHQNTDVESLQSGRSRRHSDGRYLATGDRGRSSHAAVDVDNDVAALVHGRRPSLPNLLAMASDTPGMGPISPTHPNHGARGRQMPMSSSTDRIAMNNSIASLPRTTRLSSRYATAMQRPLPPPRHSLSLSFSQLPNLAASADNEEKMTVAGLRGSTTTAAPLDNAASASALLTPAAPKVESLDVVDDGTMYTILVVTCYSEGEAGLRSTIESLVETDYPDNQKLLFIVADGLIKGSGNEKSTPETLVDMMEVDPQAGLVHGQVWSKIVHAHGFAKEELSHEPGLHEAKPGAKYMSTACGPLPAVGEPGWLPEAYSYVAIADGQKRHNMARVFAGHYCSKGHRVPALVVVKCGTPQEATNPKPGNRGKRDSQIVLMSFLSKVLFDDRMTPLEYDIFLKIRYLMGVSPDAFEVVLNVDADTLVMPDCLTHMTAVMRMDHSIMGLCGETKIANKTTSWVTMIQVFEYFISHHLNKAFESIFGGVTCLPGCFCMYRIKAPKGPPGYWVPVLASPDIVDSYSENVTDTLHKKNLLLLGEDRYLTTLMLKTFPKRKMVFVPSASCKTQVPEEFKVLLSQRRRWINSTVHNLFELVLVPDLCGTFCCSMQFVIFMELVGTLVLPAAIVFTIVLLVSSFIGDPQIIPLALLAAILGLPAFLIFFTSRSPVYALYMLCYLISLPIWNFVLPVYAYWHFDDFSWGETRKVDHSDPKEVHGAAEGIFDSSQIYMKRWHEFEAEYTKKMTELAESSPPHPTIPLYAQDGGVGSSSDIYAAHK